MVQERSQVKRSRTRTGKGLSQGRALGNFLRGVGKKVKRKDSCLLNVYQHEKGARASQRTARGNFSMPERGGKQKGGKPAPFCP